ncbi:MAG: hypothetical protein JKX98_10270 [Alcanivoracaceae bacterium]|nr:hypothetical protein [Alcanivoracaceae bacterium]
MKSTFKLIIIFGLLFSIQSQALLITGAFTGAWYNQEEPGQGFIIQIIEAEEGTEAIVFWFSFDAEGNQLWLFGVAPVEGDHVTLDMLITTGGVNNTNGFNNTDISSDLWGTLTLQFQNCNKGSVDYSSLDEAIGSGSYTIKRLTRTVGSQCSGGTSDNNPPDTSSDVQIDFVNTGEDEDASGRLKYEQNSEFNQLKIWYKKLPAGSYDLIVGGEIKAELIAKANGQSHQFFSSPQHDNWILLDFEVLGKTIDIAQDGVVYLTVDMPQE